jgi:hypothetical protein
MSTLQEAVPDLLRRFSSTPHVANAVVEGLALTLQTNDLQIIAASQQIVSGGIDLDGHHSILVRVVRDDNAPGDVSETVVISAWPLVTLLAGAGTMIALDGERQEVLGFLSPAVSAERFVDELLPILLRRFRSETCHERRGLASGTI